jgi:hypothetical protein
VGDGGWELAARGQSLFGDVAGIGMTRPCRVTPADRRGQRHG